MAKVEIPNNYLGLDVENTTWFETNQPPKLLIMRNLKVFGSLFLAMLSCFTLGCYTVSTLHMNQIIEIHRWILTSAFGLMFLVHFLFEYRKK